MVFFILIHLHSFLIFTPARLESIRRARGESTVTTVCLVSVWIGKFRFKIEGLGLELGDATEP